MFTSEPQGDLLTGPKGEGLAVLPAMLSECAAMVKESKGVPDNTFACLCQSEKSASYHFSQKSIEDIFN